MWQNRCFQGRTRDFKLGGRGIEVKGPEKRKSPIGVQGQSPGMGSEAEAFLCMKA